jgi:tetratricopeptide (TPR) repeat protein
MWNFLLLVSLLASAPLQIQESLRGGITIINTGKTGVPAQTYYDAGFEGAGHILNNHYFPGVNQYNAGRYVEAEGNLTYFLDRPDYIIGNPRRAQFLSTAFFLRGRIYLYYAEGVGRHSLAKTDFEAAIRWNPKNGLAYLELSRVYSSLGIRDQAIVILEHLLARKPEETVAEEATAELEKLKSIPTNSAESK